MRNTFSRNRGPGSFTGAKILLVEDNPVNLRLATAIVEWLGCAIIAVDSGEKAIERLCHENGIDLVLMDCQMPGMDGFEAIRIIRTMQMKDEIPRLPVIALTAFAMKGDRERCLEAGMDDYLAKPLRKEALGEVLTKWLEKPVVDDDRQVVRDDIEFADTPCLDPQIFEDVRALMGVRFEDAVQLYIKDTDDRIGAIEHMLSTRGNAKTILLEAHSIKSSSAHMGAARLAVLAGNVETGAQDALDHHGNTTSLAPLVGEIRAVFAQTQQSFRQFG